MHYACSTNAVVLAKQAEDRLVVFEYFGTDLESEAIDPTQADLEAKVAIQSMMKQPTEQEERNEDKKKPEKENPARGIDPESKEPEMDTEKK